MTNISELSQGDIAALKSDMERVRPLLELEGEWMITDIPEDEWPYTVRQLCGLCQRMVEMGALTIVSRDYYNDIRSIRNTYRWNQDAKERLQDYLNHRPTLPCGHAYHIVHREDGDGYTCKYCPDDKKPVYSRETLKECSG